MINVLSHILHHVFFLDMLIWVQCIISEISYSGYTVLLVQQC